jgi:hypothetical protein
LSDIELHCDISPAATAGEATKKIIRRNLHIPPPKLEKFGNANRLDKNGSLF